MEQEKKLFFHFSFGRFFELLENYLINIRQVNMKAVEQREKLLI